ncbi:E3 ubiquitin-protein ligase SP1 [Selaginella moellendorffii]|uniref:E3 ubiquitin-protein ligase SP1 n=1 Tax=Selaginella moellendorffii TaxID=88036 RepID=UPI000D1C2B00|nr:E3 ubiquitin-protein ligase SP1 [Selaginella moellendorffii]XP_024530513.1 E3 ubiquitin-protein ligase SP1 [Selaginella moellendorffii]|eukprot:XP_024514852.1 E3 ubiquitin-protein ligase SP1 [Selaginella moellendorffii]
MLPWGGITMCLSGVALYFLSRNSGRDAATLKAVRRVDQLKDLAHLLDSACKAVPLVVTVAGRVGSETPIGCDHSSLRCVILEETAEQHFLKHNDTGSWIQDSALMLSNNKEVPWFLEDASGRVFIVGARGAAGLELTIASEVFEESGRSLVRGTLDYLQGLKMLGVKRVERVLPTGTALTVVGEAIKDDQGTLRIQRPHKGPFYVTPKSIDQLIANLGKWSRWYKYMSLGFTLFGVFLVASHTIRYVMEKRRRAALNRRVMEAAARRRERKEHEEVGEFAKVETATKRDGRLPDLCVICLEQEYNAVFVPCGHMCCCISCSAQLQNCPLCRRRIEQIVKTYRH